MERTEGKGGSCAIMVIVAIVVAIILIGGWFIFDSYKKQDSKSVVTESSDTKTPATSNPAESDRAPETAVTAGPAPVEPVFAETETPRYYLVMGSFLIPDNADDMLKTLKQRGFENAKILPALDNGFIPVSAGDFETQQEAYEFFYSTGYYFEDFWIYKR